MTLKTKLNANDDDDMTKNQKNNKNELSKIPDPLFCRVQVFMYVFATVDSFITFAKTDRRAYKQLFTFSPCVSPH